ncbi:hypothetical protein EDB81DRAFT_395877 [Dactylonectria macrodidyma]|uniref:Uncharacterized protein n=1 Tax=Dactylonectria macrodidyma TaxID=307937 RepID=A0A9P9F8D9_9HYPO|nr:hypothetical protein EDB81DRAFT_395877 [Dactylonectria macrodidyma]
MLFALALPRLGHSSLAGTGESTFGAIILPCKKRDDVRRRRKKRKKGIPWYPLTMTHRVCPCARVRNYGDAGLAERGAGLSCGRPSPSHFRTLFTMRLWCLELVEQARRNRKWLCSASKQPCVAVCLVCGGGVIPSATQVLASRQHHGTEDPSTLNIRTSICS